jgi:hypothetical protein
LDLDDPRDNEVPTQVNGLNVLISEDIKGYADRSLIDYINSPRGSGFVVRSGNSSC